MKSNLDELPASTDKEFWQDADMHRVEPKTWFDQTHYFERIAGHQAQCTHCNWGFQLEPGDKIREGHLYDRANKLVI